MPVSPSGGRYKTDSDKKFLVLLSLFIATEPKPGMTEHHLSEFLLVSNW